MSKVTSNNLRTIVTVTSLGPKGDKGDSFSPQVNKTIHISGSEYSGSLLTALTVTGSIIPEGDGSWDLGSATNPFRDLFVTTESIKFVSRTTKQVVSSLSAKDVDDLKQGKTITTQSKSLTKKDGTTESKTSYVEGSAFISSLDNDVYIKTATNQLDLIAGGSGTGTINIGSPRQETNLGPTNITGSLNLTGSLFVGHLAKSGSYAYIDWIASSSIASLTAIPGNGSLGVGPGVVNIFDNQFHHLADPACTFNSIDDPYYGTRFYIGNRIVNLMAALFGGTGPQIPIDLIVSSSGNIGIGTMTPAHTLHISGNNHNNWRSLMVEGPTELSGSLPLYINNELFITSTPVNDTTYIGSQRKIVIRSNTQKSLKIGDNIYFPVHTTHSGNFHLDGNFSSSGYDYWMGGDVTLGKTCSDTINVKGNLVAHCNITASGNISSSGTITASNILASSLIIEGDFFAGGSDTQVLYNSGSLPNMVVTASGGFTFDYNTNGLNVDGGITCSGLLSTEPIYAPAFIETGTGTPTITSDSNLVLSASNAVVIASSPLRLRSFTDANTGSGEYSFIAGDIYFNSTTNKFMGHNGSTHVVIGTQS